MSGEDEEMTVWESDVLFRISDILPKVSPTVILNVIRAPSGTKRHSGDVQKCMDDVLKSIPKPSFVPILHKKDPQTISVASKEEADNVTLLMNIVDDFDELEPVDVLKALRRVNGDVDQCADMLMFNKEQRNKMKDKIQSESQLELDSITPLEEKRLQHFGQIFSHLDPSTVLSVIRKFPTDGSAFDTDISEELLKLTPQDTVEKDEDTDDVNELKKEISRLKVKVAQIEKEKKNALLWAIGEIQQLKQQLPKKN